MNGAMNGASALHQFGFVPGWVPGDVHPEAMEGKKRAQSSGEAQATISVPVADDVEVPSQVSTLLKPPPSAM